MSANHVHSKPFIEVIKRRLAHKRMSIRKLADKSAVNRVHLGQFLNGEKQMGSDGLGRIFRQLKIGVGRKKRKVEHPVRPAA